MRSFRPKPLKLGMMAERRPLLRVVQSSVSLRAIMGASANDTGKILFAQSKIASEDFR